MRLCFQEIIDHETWTFDLQSANNEGNEPNWFKLYSAKEEYEMNSLRPMEWDMLINKMKVNGNLFKRFYRFVLITIGINNFYIISE